MKKESTYINYHMNLSDRIAIEQGLREGKAFKEIGEELQRDPTTVAKEIKRAVGVMEKTTFTIDCKYIKQYRSCDLCLSTNYTGYHI